MSTASHSIFREAAIERLSSPEQLDELVGITRPADWVTAAVIAAAVVALVAWSLLGRISTRVAAEGMLIGHGGKVVDAVSAFGGRLTAVDVSVGDQVAQGQVIARLSQPDLDERHRAAVAILQEREREDAQLTAAIAQELAAKSRSFAAQIAGFEQSIATAEERVQALSSEIRTLEQMMRDGLTTQPDIDQRRVELYAARQRITDARNTILGLSTQKLDLEAQRSHDRLASQFRVDDSRREAGQLAGMLQRMSRVVSPSEGRITEIKVSAGAVLAVGTPVAGIETGAGALQAVLYVPADYGKSVTPGMTVRVEPSAIKREEFGAMIGRVASISQFPVTPEGMAALLHNGDLVRRFAQSGAPYEAVVELAPDPATTSGYRWSSGAGPSLRLTPGTLAHAEITTRDQAPIDLVVPLMRRLSGRGG